MTIRRAGFTMLEMLFVVVIGGIVLAIGTRQYSQLSNQRAVGNASNAMVHTASRARSEAMRSGRVIYLRIRPDLAQVRVRSASDSAIHTLDAGADGVSITGSTISICYAARGYALPGCTSISGTQTVNFVRGVDTATVQVLPLGQVRRTR
ncbi:MAG TPA: prepilin-type N-terminal cleavage/methylation domain-containing protein [Longimicrobiales bacterium]|nr:prepilin-type N-terminal cleavage/methylation domain-containing protein [Longimicrobiales bacterium]